MLDLTYPHPDDYPQSSLDDCPLIDESGHVIGRASRLFCHGGSMALHPVVHLHIFNSAGALYLQKRSMHKDIQPGKWDTAVGGHVDYGEQIREALLREAREELHLPIVQVEELFRYVWQSAVEREVVHAFATCYDGPIEPDHNEVDEGRFWTCRELQEAMGHEIFTPQFEQELPRLLQSKAGQHLFSRQ